MRIDNPDLQNSYDWSSGNVTYVPIAGDINTYITNATAGDTLVLAAGTYTITSAITVNKKLHIMGQGMGITTITTATADIDIITTSITNDIMISDMTLQTTAVNTVANKAMINIGVNTKIYNVEFLNVATGAVNTSCIYNTINGLSNYIENCIFNCTGAALHHLILFNSSTATNYIRNCYGTSANDTSGTGGRGIQANAGTVNIYSSYFSNSANHTGGLIQNNGASINIYNSTLNASGATNFDVASTSGTLTLYNTTLVNNTTSGTISYVNPTSISKSGNIYYSYLGEDLDTLIASTKITAGDTIVLASGTYTIIDDIDIGKAINIVGQGAGNTIITCATASKNIFDIGVSTVRISNLSLNPAAAGTSAINTSHNLSAIVLENLIITSTSTGVNTVKILGTNATLQNITLTAAPGSTWSSLIYVGNTSATTQNAIVNAYNVRLTGSATGSSTYGFELKNVNDANTITFNCYNCISNISGSASDIAFVCYSTTTNNAIMNLYNCVANGNEYDVFQTGTNILTLYSCTLVNNTISGTIAYGGTTVGTGFNSGNGGSLVALSAGDDKNITISHNDTTGLITSSDGTISFDNENLTTTGNITGGNLSGTNTGDQTASDIATDDSGVTVQDALDNKLESEADTLGTVTARGASTATASTFSGGIVLSNSNLTTIKSATFNSEIDHGNSGATHTIDWGAGNKQKITISEACTITFTDPAGATNLILKIVNGGAAAISWTAGDEPKWAGGTDPAWTASGTDILALYFDGTTYYGSTILDAK